MDGEVDGDVEDLGSLGVVHAEEEDVAPAAVGEVHADGRALAENRIGAGGGIAPPPQLRQRDGALGQGLVDQVVELAALGQLDGHDCWALRLGELPAGSRGVPLRAAMMQLDLAKVPRGV